MPIEFREIRPHEVDEALAFAVDQGAAVDDEHLQHRLSLLARNCQKTILGSALHHIDDDRRRHVAVHLAPDIHPGLARLLIDRALQKAEAHGLATASVTIAGDEIEASTWSGANWAGRLSPCRNASASTPEPGPPDTPDDPSPAEPSAPDEAAAPPQEDAA